MASGTFDQTWSMCREHGREGGARLTVVLFPSRSEPAQADGRNDDNLKESVPLPQTLVRIPTEHAPALQAQTETAAKEEGS